MRFAPTLDEFSAMRPLVDLVEERIAQRSGQTLAQYRAAKAGHPITTNRKLPNAH